MARIGGEAAKTAPQVTENSEKFGAIDASC